MKAILFAGQGAQYKGMGSTLFGAYRSLVDSASDILGYSLEELCLRDPNKQLNNTQFTQPALFAVNHLNYLRNVVDGSQRVDYAAGHSLGEYNALAAAGVFSFETGLRLVQRRGALMARASGGGMAAILGLSSARLTQLLQDEGYTSIDVANFNTPTQTVISGDNNALQRFQAVVERNQARFVPLNTSAAFHSRYMSAAQQEFAEFLRPINFKKASFPVISNVSAEPYGHGDVAEGLAQQVSGSVRWVESVQRMLDLGVTEFLEFETHLLTRMVDEIKSSYTPLAVSSNVTEFSTHASKLDQAPKRFAGITAQQLGDASFREEYETQYSYVAGGMYRGIASEDLVVRMINNGFMAYFGAGGVPISELGQRINGIKSRLQNPAKAGFNLLCNLEHPDREMATVELYLKHNIQRVEAAAYLQMTEALVYYRVAGLSRVGGEIVCRNKILAKVSRPEVAEAFMNPPPQEILTSLLNKGLISAEQVVLAQGIPMAQDICVEADSGGHTDGGNPSVIFPAIVALQRRKQQELRYTQPIRIGLAGGIGSPESATSAFVMGAAFVLTGSINQCTVEAGTSDAVKDLLQQINVQDTAYAPAADMFEIGARVQVLKKGVFFPARANKLYALYQQYDSLNAIPEEIRTQLEERYLGRSFESIWQERKQYLEKNGRHTEVANAERRPKLKMSSVFKWYFSEGSRAALRGELQNKVNFQVHTGPALGAFNQWVKGTELESWRNRHVDQIARKLLEESAELLSHSLIGMVS